MNPDGNIPDSSNKWEELLTEAHAALEDAKRRINELEKKNAQLEKEIAQLKNKSAGHGTKLDESYSFRAEEKRQQQRGRRKKRKKDKTSRHGRIANELKIKLADRTEDVYPDGVPRELCRFSHVRVIWRLLETRVQRIAYRVFRGPKKQYGKIPGVIGRSEYGLEIVVELAFLVQHVGLSLDKLCQTVSFLQDLHLGKSQVEALLKQLADYWSDEFEILCALLANSLVVHTDETGWSLKSVWVFLSEKARVLLFGVNKDAETLKKILDWEKFTGLVFSDDAAVYANFSKAQKCWAHLLRKAIKLTLQRPCHEGYRQFTDELLSIYHAACRLQHDSRRSVASKERKEKDLLRRVFALCSPVRKTHAMSTGLDHTWYLLAEELVRLALRDELFQFVLTDPEPQPNGSKPSLDGTNNASERELRGAAQARVTGRTSKTLSGARRTTILSSVLESLRLYLEKYTLSSVIAEISRWQETGKSCFRELLEDLGIKLPTESVLDRVHPQPSG